jgi:choline dehydrogenase-like flavoprotein
MPDYVIVGAGSAGCVLAARLSEDPDASVTLIEAGGPDTAQELHVPAAFPALQKSELDWDLQSEPEPGLDGRRNYLPRGKVLGGTSCLNAMVYIRGNQVDYDTWAGEDGAEGWDYENVLPYFKKSEDNERGEDQFHGTGGPLSVSESRSNHVLADAWIEAAKKAGHEQNPDFNGARQEGVGRYQATQRNGMRCSTAVGFLHPAMERPNLDVVTGALVTRILLDGTRATGVEIQHGGELKEIRAEREVIVSAGAYGSPQLLMLSGIGPAADLELLLIPVVQDLPVGEGLQDHPMALLNFLTDEESMMTAMSEENVALLESEGRGPLTSNLAEAGGFMRTRSGLDAPDVQFHMAPVLYYDEGLGPATDHGFAFGPCVLKPTSRGFVKLRTPLPISKPRIFSNFYDTQEDRDTMIAGVKLALEMAAQEELTAVTRGPFKAPASDSEEDIWDFVKDATQCVYHPTSTCAIGKVVDPELKVLGIDGLRVVDASVMPSITRGNTNAPTIMIAERAADLIAA